MPNSQFFDGPGAIGLHLQQLLYVIIEQGSSVLRAKDVKVKPNATSVVYYLHCYGSCSAAELADFLKISHQLVSQRITWLEKNSLVRIVPDSQDNRRRIVQLTSEGKKEARKLHRVLEQTTAAFSELMAEMGVDLVQVIKKMERSLVAKPLIERVAEGVTK